MPPDLANPDESPLPRQGTFPADSFALYAPGLRRYSLRLLADAALAEDVVQQTFEIAVVSYPSLRHPDRIKAWLFAIARNECLQLLAQPRSSPLTEDYPADAALRPDESTAATDLHDNITRALDALPSIYRQAVTLRDMEGFSYAEIASMTGVSLSAVKFRIYKGRDLLMNALSLVLKEWRML
jgi:RNA polymerase sigma factor (sigma-70 family)